MITICDNSKQKDVIAYIGEDYPKCLYLYMDVIKYGCASDTTRTWMQIKDGKTLAVFLAYHTALHIYSKNNDFELQEICELVEKVNPSLVNATAETIKIIEPVLKEKGFQSEFGHISEWLGDDDVIEEDEVVMATENDIPEIARLLYEDKDIGASYFYEDLLMQIKDRLEQGYVRSYVIRKDQKPIAHVGTGAEMDGICTIAYTITSKDYRGKGLAGRLYKYACNKLRREGRRIFSVYYPESARLFHHKMGFVDVCEYGKLFRSVE